MTDQANLERGYRRLLAWYPQSFRREHGEELIAVLMACAPDGLRRPGLAASADLIRSGLWMRLRPSVPRSAPTVRAAVRLMYAGAAVTTLGLIIAIISVAVFGVSAGSLRLLGHSQQFPVVIAVGIMVGLVLIGLWLWMAWANGQGRNWARVLSTVLFGLATLHLFHNKGLAQVVFALVTWLVGLAVVWLLWCPASNAFFKPQDWTRVGPGEQPSLGSR
ncbi:MAG: hypothetical protein WAO09_01040 [Candidatus Dormiibacterota bacterium]|jgi:hypothetical protein